MQVRLVVAVALLAVAAGCGSPGNDLSQDDRNAMSQVVDRAKAQTGIDFRSEVGSQEKVNLLAADICQMKREEAADLTVLAEVQDRYPDRPQYNVGLFTGLAVGTLCRDLMSGEMKEGMP